ncbi:unnamed protein product [Leptosia nina]|uniref:Uncharacterized protein n=1 Tax=Leptosia nina TaxID=320188 RepID=A0AAV1JYW5_9NEOP
MQRPGPLWCWLTALTLGLTTAYTDTEEFLSDLDKPEERSNVFEEGCNADLNILVGTPEPCLGMQRKLHPAPL